MLFKQTALEQCTPKNTFHMVCCWWIHKEKMYSNHISRLLSFQADYLNKTLMSSSFLVCFPPFSAVQTPLLIPTPVSLTVSSLQFPHLLFSVSPDSTIVNLSIYLPLSPPAVLRSASAEYPARLPAFPPHAPHFVFLLNLHLSPVWILTSNLSKTLVISAK